MDITIRPVQPNDLAEIAAIYNHAVHHTAATFDTHPKPPSDFTIYLPPPTPSPPSLHRILVATVPNPTQHTLVAYAGTSPFKPRAAYDQTAEVMVYVHPDFQSRGIGMALLRRLHDRASGVLKGVHTTLGVMNSANAAARGMFERLGYALRGELVDVGWKFGRRWSVVIYQLQLETESEEGVETNVEGKGDGEGQGRDQGLEGDQAVVVNV